MLLSIIIPAYNVERYILKTLNMLIEQGLQNIEIIVINDGSTDSTFDICAKSSNNNSNIIVFNQKNLGVSAARNQGIKLATGKFIYFLDADDSLEEGTLNFFRACLEQNQHINLFSFGYKSVANNKIKKYVTVDYNNKLLNQEEFKKLFLFKKIKCHICSIICKRDIILSNSLLFTPNLSVGEDLEFLLRLTNIVDNILYLSRICFIYQIRSDSVMQGYNSYSMKQFQSFEVIYSATNLLRNSKLDQYCNYFIVNNYISNLRYYLLSDSKSKSISANFKKYEFALSYKLPMSKLRFVQLIIKIIFPFLIKK